MRNSGLILTYQSDNQRRAHPVTLGMFRYVFLHSLVRLFKCVVNDLFWGKPRNREPLDDGLMHRLHDEI